MCHPLSVHPPWWCSSSDRMCQMIRGVTSSMRQCNTSSQRRLRRSLQLFAHHWEWCNGRLVWDMFLDLLIVLSASFSLNHTIRLHWSQQGVVQFEIHPFVGHGVHNRRRTLSDRHILDPVPHLHVRGSHGTGLSVVHRPLPVNSWL